MVSWGVSIREGSKKLESNYRRREIKDFAKGKGAKEAAGKTFESRHNPKPTEGEEDVSVVHSESTRIVIEKASGIVTSHLGSWLLITQALK